MKNHPLSKRIGFALAGLAQGWRRERSFRTHVMAAALALIALCALRPPAVWWAIVILVIAMVLATELLNSALETLVDRLHPDVHPEIRVAKDMAAGSVLLVAFASVLIAVLLVLSTI